jgi:hypothetical protein
VEDAPGGFAGLKRDWPLADQYGRATWPPRSWSATTFEEVLHSADAKVLHGDPRRLFLILLPPSGDGVLLGWSQLIEALRLAYMALEGVAAVGGTVAFGKLVYDSAKARLARGRNAIEEHYPQLQERGAVPMQLDGYLCERVWHVADLASTLGCNEDLARAILEAWGFAESPTIGLWRLEGDEPAELIRGLHREVITSIAFPAVDPFERAFRQRAEQYAATGEHPPPPAEADYKDDEGDNEWESDALDGTTVPCVCGREDCQAVLRISRVWDASGSGTRVRLRIDDFKDHFDVKAPVLGLILGTLAD